MDSSRSSIAGPKVPFRPARNSCLGFGAANCHSPLRWKRPVIWLRILPTCFSPVSVYFCIHLQVDRRAAGGIGFRNLLQLLRLVCPRPSTVHLGTVPAHVPSRVLLCFALLPRALVAEI